jgi:type IV fimbrial biogenesis protein FimT
LPPTPLPRLRPASGATLVELLAVTVIVAVLCAVALPKMDGMLARLRADSVRMQMVTAFNMARNTAITHSRPVAVCPSPDGRTCAADWHRGWLIYYDRGAPVGVPAEPDILQFQAGTSARGIRATTSTSRPRLRFQRDGRSSGSPLTVSICAGDVLHSEVIVNNVGRTRARRVQEPLPCPR